MPGRPSLSAVWPPSGARLSRGPSPPRESAGEPALCMHRAAEQLQGSPGDSDGPAPHPRGSVSCASSQALDGVTSHPVSRLRPLPEPPPQPAGSCCPPWSQRKAAAGGMGQGHG